MVDEINDLTNQFYHIFFSPNVKGHRDSDYRPMETQYASYTNFLSNLGKMFEARDKEFFRRDIGGVLVTGEIVISNFRLEAQRLCDDTPMTPRMARLTGSTLNCEGIGDVKQIMRVIRYKEGISSDERIEEVQEYVIAEDTNSKILTIPLMVMEGGRTSLNLQDRNDYSPMEFGGYFIIKGNEKIASNSTSMVPNRPKIYVDGKTFRLYMKSYQERKQVQFLSLKVNLRPSNIITFSSQKLNDVNAVVLMRWFGLSDRMIFDLLVQQDERLAGLAEKWIADSRAQGDDLAHIKSKTVQKSEQKLNKVREESEVSMQEYFENGFLPHLNTASLSEKAIYLCYLVRKLLVCTATNSSNRYYDKDSLIGKQFLTVGYYLKTIVQNSLLKILRKNTDLFRLYAEETPHAIYNLINHKSIADIRNILGSFTTAEITNDLGVLVSLGTFTNHPVITNIERYSQFSFVYAARKIHKTLRQPKQTITKMLDARDFHVSHVGFIDPNETPEHGANVGLTLSLAMVASISCISTEEEQEVFKAIVDFIKSEDHGMVNLDNPNQKFTLIVESKIIGFVQADRAYDLYILLRHKKRSGAFRRDDIGIIYDFAEREIRVNIYEGRLIKPLLIFGSDGLHLALEELSIPDKVRFAECQSFTEMCSAFPHVFEFVDAEQFAYSMVCLDFPMLVSNRQVYETLQKNNHASTGEFVRFELMEAPSEYLNSLITLAMIAPNFIMGTRVIFGTSQLRAFAGISTPDYKNTLANSMFMPGPEQPLLSSEVFEHTRISKAGYGHNAMVALGEYFGYQKDDSLIVKRSSVERGFLLTELTKKAIKQIDVSNETNSLATCIRITDNYDKLNSRGVCDVGTVVVAGDVMVKNIVPISKQTTTGEIITVDNSEVYNHNFPGRVCSHVINQQTNKKEHRIQTNSFKPPVPGDKLGTRSAQKGTICNLFADHLLPYDENGSSPDIIANPLAIPGRKTGSFWIEALINACYLKKGAKPMNFRSFEGSFEDIMAEAKKILGPDLFEVSLYNPITRRACTYKVFYAPVYYGVSRHKVEDKAYGRSKGAVNQITRQANRGRGNGGGLKFGEMERDCLIAQGASACLYSILSDSYDNQTFLYFCTRCKMQARYFRDFFDQEHQLCANCVDGQIEKTHVPYVYQTFTHETLARGIVIGPSFD